MYTIGDFLIRIKNAYLARKKQIVIPYSRINTSIGTILEEEGYVKKIKNQKSKIKNSERKMLVVELKYEGKSPAISDIKIISKPSVHMYARKATLRKGLHDVGIGIVSTSKGIMTDKKAYKQGLGGELICRIF